MRSVQNSLSENFSKKVNLLATLHAEKISKHYRSFTGKTTIALDQVSFSIYKGEIVSLVGESGSGKTTLAKILCGLAVPTSGKVWFKGRNIFEMNKEELRTFRIKVQYIPQYPDLSLDPKWYLYDSVAEPLRIHRMVSSKEEELERVKEVCERVGIKIDQLIRRPRDVSGGELQRAVIARALILSPEVLIADEPTSMLDPSLQAKIIRILLDLNSESSIGMLFITHDLELAKIVSKKTFVMLGGRIVESGPTDQIMKNPLHPYTKSLLIGSLPAVDPSSASSCGFYNECKIRSDVCRRYPPPMSEVDGNRSVRCWIYV